MFVLFVKHICCEAKDIYVHNMHNIYWNWIHRAWIHKLELHKNTQLM